MLVWELLEKNNKDEKIKEILKTKNSKETIKDKFLVVMPWADYDIESDDIKEEIDVFIVNSNKREEILTDLPNWSDILNLQVWQKSIDLIDEEVLIKAVVKEMTYLGDTLEKFTANKKDFLEMIDDIKKNIKEAFEKVDSLEVFHGWEDIEEEEKIILKKTDEINKINLQKFDLDFLI